MEQQRDWSTNLFDCAKDEESCWWSTWCCWMVFARTTHSFDLGNSYTNIVIFWLYIILVLLSSLFGFQFIVLLLGAIIFAAIRANIRTKIRGKLHVAGSYTSDCLSHFFCACCAVCQEAREANEVGTPVLDYCSGERIENQEIAHEVAIGRQGQPITSAPLIDGGTFWSHVKALSQTSKIIMSLCGLVAVITLIALASARKGAHIVILLLAFLQPFLLLYFVYWRNRRQYASLDMVVKLFAVGFWFTTFQSVIIEEILSYFLFLIFGSVVFGLDNAGNDGDDEPSNVTSGMLKLLSARHFTATFYWGNSVDQSLQVEDSEISEDAFRQSVRSHILIATIAMLCMAYIIAAGVEETMKHFIVRCCRFPSPLKDPHTILVYLMAGALGFATSENIEYVFGVAGSRMPGQSVFVTELIILLIRVLMPIHVICSVLQASRLSKALLDRVHGRFSLIWILTPAILLHGTFDFVLFFLGLVQFAFDVDSFGLEIASFAIAGAITVFGAIFAYRSFTKIQENFLAGWQSVHDIEEAIDYDSNL